MSQHNEHLDDQFNKALKQRLSSYRDSVQIPEELRTAIQGIALQHNKSQAMNGSSKVVRLFKEYTFASVASVIVIASVAVISAIDFFSESNLDTIHADKNVLSAWVAQQPFAENTLESGTLSNLASYFTSQELDVRSSSYDELFDFFRDRGLECSSIPKLSNVDVIGGRISQVQGETVAHIVLKSASGHFLYMCSLPRSLIRDDATSLSPHIQAGLQQYGRAFQCNGDTSASIAIWGDNVRVHSLASCISVQSIQEYVPR